MEIIAGLEPTHRGPYAGAVGYFGYDGNLDTAIAIRTLLIKDGTAYVKPAAAWSRTRCRRWSIRSR